MTALDGRKIPIHKVRVRIDKQPRTIGEGLRERRIISGTGSNYASMIYAELDEKGNEVRWFDKIVTRLEAYERLSANRSKQGEKVLIPEESETRRFKFSLRRNDALLLEGPDGKDILYRIQNISKGDIQLCEHIFPIVPKQDKWNRIRSMDTLRRRNIRRVIVSPIGEVHRIGD
jgi:CRISPR-associated endonuclease Csn1